MILNRLSTVDTKAAINLMSQSHNLYIKVRWLDLDHNILGDDLSERFAGGTVAYDASAAITRGLDLDLWDPRGDMHLDPFSPSRTGVFITHMIQIIYIITPPDRSVEYHWHVFTGPIDKVERDGLYISLKCLGKEVLLLDKFYRAKTYKEGRKKTDVIKDILRDGGEVHYNIPDLKTRLPNHLKLNRKDSPWTAAKKLADSMGYQLYYDGRGYAVMRRWPNKVSVTFNEENMTSRPHIADDMRDVINAVRVIGKKPKKAKRSPKGTAVAPPGHELSPRNLGRKVGGEIKSRWIWEELRDDGARTKRECVKRAWRHLNRRLRASKEVKFDGAPMPMLEEHDVSKLNTEWAGAEFDMVKWDLPLVAGEDAAYGYVKRRAPKRPGKNKKDSKAKKNNERRSRDRG